jgi:4a-hydroxytetrahydrobiopterin dehydratase
MAVEDKAVLTPADVEAELNTLEGWHRNGAVIRREFVLASFRDITDFLRHLVETIATHNHHPDFSLDTAKRQVSVSVTTHSKKAITRADILFARVLNQWRPRA